MNRSLRHAKRYVVDDSPLTAISWWRLMLDEAQNVGDGFSQVHSQAEGTAKTIARCLWLQKSSTLELTPTITSCRPPSSAERKVWLAELACC